MFDIRISVSEPPCMPKCPRKSLWAALLEKSSPTTLSKIKKSKIHPIIIFTNATTVQHL